jgi:hypothetical protein
MIRLKDSYAYESLEEAKEDFKEVGYVIMKEQKEERYYIFSKQEYKEHEGFYDLVLIKGE